MQTPRRHTGGGQHQHSGAAGAARADKVQTVSLPAYKPDVLQVRGTLGGDAVDHNNDDGEQGGHVAHTGCHHRRAHAQESNTS